MLRILNATATPLAATTIIGAPTNLITVKPSVTDVLVDPTITIESAVIKKLSGYSNFS